MKALILDDQKEKALLISEWLKQLKFKPSICSSYDEAIKLYDTYFNVLIVDYKLGNGKTGEDFIRNYCNRYHPQMNILYTAYPNELPDGVKAVDFDDVRDILFSNFDNSKECSISDIVFIRENISQIMEWKRVHEIDYNKFCSDVEQRFKKIELFVEKANKFIDRSKYSVALIVLAYLVLPNEGFIKLIKLICEAIWK